MPVLRSAGRRPSALNCDYWVGQDCCNLSGIGVWVCNSGPGGEACTVSTSVGNTRRCSEDFEQRFYAPLDSPARPVGFTAHRDPDMGFPGRRRARRWSNPRLRPRAFIPAPFYYPWWPPHRIHFGVYENFPGLGYVGAPVYYRP